MNARTLAKMFISKTLLLLFLCYVSNAHLNCHDSKMATLPNLSMPSVQSYRVGQTHIRTWRVRELGRKLRGGREKDGWESRGGGVGWGGVGWEEQEASL